MCIKCAWLDKKEKKLFSYPPGFTHCYPSTDWLWFRGADVFKMWCCSDTGHRQRGLYHWDWLVIVDAWEEERDESKGGWRCELRQGDGETWTEREMGKWGRVFEYRVKSKVTGDILNSGGNSPPTSVSFSSVDFLSVLPSYQINFRRHSHLSSAPA